MALGPENIPTDRSEARPPTGDTGCPTAPHLTHSHTHSKEAAMCRVSHHPSGTTLAFGSWALQRPCSKPRGVHI